MIIRKANKYRLDPTPEQAHKLTCFAGACRFVYNLALEQRRDHWQRFRAVEGKSISYVSQANELPYLKAAAPWLKDAHSQILQQALKDLDRAYINFFAGRAAYPRPRKKGLNDTFRYPEGGKIPFKRTGRNTGQIKLPKIGWVRLRGWYDVPGTVRSVTVRLNGGHWSVSLQWERSYACLLPSGTAPIGIDRGVARFAALSDGTMIDSINANRTLGNRIARVQRALSRKTRGSANWHKQKRKLTRLRGKEADIRRDFLNKISTTIAKNHGTVVMEDLKVRNMSASARGTNDNPGRNVKAKAGLNRSILDQGWHMFQTRLDYKMISRGRKLVLVNPAYTSQTCHACSAVSKENRPEQDRFKCASCGHTDHADVNAAKNILRQGLASMPVKERGHTPDEAGTIPQAA